MTKTAAQVLGGLTGAILVLAWIGAKALRPPPCHGGVFVELRPPLEAPGPYRFEISMPGEREACRFEVPLPLVGPVNTSQCPVVLELETEGQGLRSTIVRLAVGATPERFRLKVHRAAEAVYDAELRPRYLSEPVPREQSRRFCGRQALVRPECVKGSSQCAPFRADCDGPEDCPGEQACCTSLDWGQKYGAKLATACLPWRRCLQRYARVACHTTDDCPEGMICNDNSWHSDFEPPVVTCRPATENR